MSVLSLYIHGILLLPDSGIIPVDIQNHQYEPMARSHSEWMELHEECNYFLNSECSDRRAKRCGEWCQSLQGGKCLTHPYPAEALVVIEALVLQDQLSAQRDAELPALRGQSRSHSQQTRCHCQLSWQQHGNSFLGIHLVWNGRD